MLWGEQEMRDEWVKWEREGMGSKIDNVRKLQHVMVLMSVLYETTACDGLDVCLVWTSCIPCICVSKIFLPFSLHTDKKVMGCEVSERFLFTSSRLLSLSSTSLLISFSPRFPFAPRIPPMVSSHSFFHSNLDWLFPFKSSLPVNVFCLTRKKKRFSHLRSFQVDLQVDLRPLSTCLFLCLSISPCLLRWDGSQSFVHQRKGR
jgi:hypothetical protein